MSAKSTLNSYGWVPVSIHWASVILILVLLGSGFNSAGSDGVPANANGLAVHVAAGATILGLTLFRIVWWVFWDDKPTSIEMPAWQDKAARAVHVLFYVVILGMVASGIGKLVLSQAAPILFGAETGQLPNFWDYPPRLPHGIGARFVIALMIFHAGAALYHHFVKRDGLLWRMWYGNR